MNSSAVTAELHELESGTPVERGLAYTLASHPEHDSLQLQEALESRSSDRQSPGRRVHCDKRTASLERFARNARTPRRQDDGRDRRAPREGAGTEPLTTRRDRHRSNSGATLEAAVTNLLVVQPSGTAKAHSK
jgi:hypothetical protein